MNACVYRYARGGSLSMLISFFSFHYVGIQYIIFGIVKYTLRLYFKIVKVCCNTRLICYKDTNFCYSKDYSE